ncbi:MAG TPA: hypothetical protein VFR15_04495, partial [Chloroflexia bacterium]|nr:hypothetical protein [Chloroflexia bacterium]
TVNGEPSKVYSAYLALRSVPVRAGESLVQFEYTPATYAFAVPISTSALIGILSLALLGCRRARQREQHENIANEPM